MNIQQIKAKTGFPTFDLVRQKNTVKAVGGELLPNGNVAVAGDNIEVKTEWLSAWDNDRRVRVSVHEDIVNKLKANPALEGLALKPAEIVTPEGKTPYTRYVMIMPTGIELSL